MIKSSFLCG